MRHLALAVAAALGCGGATGPPAGPKHDPTNSPETQSACPEKWKAAKEARELLLGDNTGAAKSRTAAAVLDQADCEVAVLAAGQFTAGPHAAIVSQVRELTGSHRDVINLYNEVANYGLPRLVVAAAVGRGRVHRAFAARLVASPMPTDMTVVGEQSAYRAEIAALVSRFEGDAEREFLLALAKGQGDAAARIHLETACAELAELKRVGVEGC